MRTARETHAPTAAPMRTTPRTDAARPAAASDATARAAASDHVGACGDVRRGAEGDARPASVEVPVAAEDLPQVSAFTLRRTGGLPAGAVDGLVVENAHRAAAAIVAAEDQMAELAGSVADALHALVPELEDDADLRRTALRLKRDVHNGRPTKQPPEAVDTVAERLDDTAAGRLTRWVTTADAVRDGRAALPDLLDDELARVRAHATETLRDDDVARGIALGSPTFLDGLRRKGVGASPAGRSARTAVGYLTRIAVKTSPFSSFTTVGLAGFGSDGGVDRVATPTSALATDDRGSSPAVVRRAAPARALATLVLLALPGHGETAGAVAYEPTAGSFDLDGAPTLIEGDHEVVDGFAWRGESFVDARELEDDLALVDGLGRVDHATLLQRLGGRFPEEALRRLVGLGVVRPVAPWPAADGDPLRHLSAALRSHGTPLADEVADDLDRIRRHAAGVADQEGPGRAAALHGTRSGARDALGRLDVAAPPWLDDAAVVYEDVRTAGDAPELPAALREDLRTIGAALRPDVVRTRVLQHLTDHFVARHGAGGTCDDVLAFLVSAGRGEQARASLGAALRADAAPDPADAHGDLGASTAPPAVNVAFQVVADDPGAVQRGEHLVVLNHHGPGTGAALARFRPLLGDEGLDHGLRGWIDALFPDAAPHVLDHGADWTDLQSTGLGLLPTLRWPGELPTTEGRTDGLDLADLRLHHDAATGLLGFRDRTGRAIAPVYLGSVPQHLLTGPVRLLLIIADPWGCVSELGKVDRPWRGIEPVVAPVVHDPRRTSGRVVLRRANWRIAADHWPRPETGEFDDELLIRLERFRREHGLPLEGFVTFERPQGAGVRRASHRKPRWIRFDSPHAVHQVAAGFDDDVLAARLVEALPGRGQHWTPGDAPARADEHVALLRWGRAA